MEAEHMEVDESPNRFMAPGGVPSVTVSLHPLVIMNISEHWTRVRAQEGRAKQVVGALIGKQSGRKLEIMNSFELLLAKVDNDMIIDKAYYTTKEEQFKQVFCDMDFLGWYTTGSDNPNESDVKNHKQACTINESPILLKLNPNGGHTDLPVTLYETVTDLVNNEPTMLFVEVPYTLATEEAERIGVDHVARMASNETGESSLVAEHLTAQYNAIKMLHTRVKMVLDYVKAVKNKELPLNHEILRELYSLTHRLPVMQSPKFNAEFYTQCNDVALITYLGSITKCCNNMNQFVNKFNILHDRQSLGRKVRGLFF
ncbi:hypothetical protein V9T40_009527 [Parthenolecanium corni]|uniref:COP9 signalosome complex subunit 6 n=1 Tax=Parthenolecanium corni TaxID=536013 RepID=A0AAN9TSH8_9HEMI